MAYSMDLRARVLRDSDAGLPTKDVAEKYTVSVSWVNRVKQRKRETGEIAPRTQTKFRGRTLDPDQEQRLLPDYRSARRDPRRIAGGAPDDGRGQLRCGARLIAWA